MSRYKLVKMKKELSFEEVEAHKDFDALIHTYNKKQQNKKLLKILVFLSFVGSVVFLVLFYPNSSNQLKSESGTIKKLPIEDSIVKDSTNEAAKPSDIIVQNIATNSPSSESVQLKMKKRVKKEKIKEEIQTNEYIFKKAYPEYGIDSLISYIQSSLKPDQTHEAKGEVVIAFTINASGEPGSVKLMKGKSKDLNKQIIELVKKMPNWKPAMLNGKPVSSTHTLPLEINTYSN